jgi:hypothetical protein
MCKAAAAVADKHEEKVGDRCEEAARSLSEQQGGLLYKTRHAGDEPATNAR